MRTAEGRPLPKMTDYQSNTDFTLGIARLLGDEQMLQDHAESVKVATLIPESLVQRVFNLVSPRRRHIKTDVVGESLPGMSAEQIARGRKRDPMF
jgi:hypothetical protein